MEIFERAGYICTKSGASLGVFDIIGIGKNDIVLVQCKSNGWPGAEEMERIENFPCPNNCKKIIHRWNDRQRYPDIREL